MFIDHNTYENSYTVECDCCHKYWKFEGYELILEPWPHVECPNCGHWIAVF